MYGAHIALALLRDGYNVQLHEVADRLFSGASGNIPARLHSGAHYPRSKLTRDACKEHYAEFMSVYGVFTNCVPINLYCIAAYDSLVDFGTYCHILRENVEFVTVARPEEFGLRNVEGAILTGERHIIVDDLREYFSNELRGHVSYGVSKDALQINPFNFTIDCTFCAYDEVNIDRFELCLTVLLSGPVDKAVTIMDGPFPSLYPWNEKDGLCSLTSAKFTPLGRYKTWDDANFHLLTCCSDEIVAQSENMIEQMGFFYPKIFSYHVEGYRLAIRAMPRSGADARLVDVVRNGQTIRIRAGKLDAVFHAERVIKSMIS